MTIQGDIKTIAVIACTKAEYVAHIEHDLIPILEQYHGLKFLKNHADGSYNAGVYKIFRCRTPEDLKGLGPYQLVKVGGYKNHPHLKEIEDIYKSEVNRRHELAKLK